MDLAARITRLHNTLRFVRALVATNMKAAFALRGAFFAGVVFMALNNLIFFTVWWIFFHRFEEIRGWRVGDVEALFGTVAAGFGLAIVFAGGIRDLGGLIAEGDLDPYLTQPKNLLLNAVGSRSHAGGLGDIASGLALLGISGLVDVATLPLALIAIATSAVMFVSTGILIHSMAFWLGRIESLARQLWEFQITFSTYPMSLFGGALRFALFTLLPAGFIGYLPVQLLRDFSWSGLGAAVAGALVYLGLALWVFHRGLARYASGSRFGVRA